MNRSRSALTALIAFQAIVGLAHAQENFDDGASRTVIADALAGFEAIQQADFRGAIRILRPLTESEEFTRVADGLKREVYILLNRAVQQRNGYAATYAYAVTITELSSVQAGDWITRMEVANRLGEAEDGVYSLTALLERWPERLSTLSIDYVAAMLRVSRSEFERADPFIGLVDALIAADWNHPDSFVVIDREWFRSALFLVERGDTGRAVELARRIQYPPILIAMQVDRRFDSLFAAAGEAVSIEGAIGRDIAAREQGVLDAPTSLSRVSSLAISLQRANRLDEALVVVNQAAQPQNNPGVDTATGWIDEVNSMPWFLNTRADLLWQMGLADIAIAQLQEASAVFATPDNPNVNQVINLARYYARSGQSDRARNAVEDMNGLTDFGEMYVRYVQLMAAVGADDSQGISAALEWMSRRQSVSRYLYQRALVLSGRLDAAAEFLIDRLEDETTRTGALVEIQIYLDDQLTEMTAPLDRLYAERKAALLARPDVRAAIEPVGRIETFQVWFTGFEV